jgi:hypothetical protein
MMDGIQFEDGQYGRRAIITSTWSDEMTDYLLRNGIVEIELNDGKGWRGNDLQFLARLPHLEWLKILDFKISSVDSLHSLHKLRTLEVMTYCRTEIRFSEFPVLEECALEWRPKATSLFDCTTLKKLFVNRYDGKDVSRFARLVNLESLAVLNAPTGNLHGFSTLKELRTLRLANLKRLTSLAGIEMLANLEEFEIHTCRGVRSIKPVGYLSRLRKFHLNNDGNVESLKPLLKLSGLESVSFYESTNILDGDLSPLLNQKNLSRVSFQNRRHYSLRREDFSVNYTSRITNG